MTKKKLSVEKDSTPDPRTPRPEEIEQAKLEYCISVLKTATRWLRSSMPRIDNINQEVQYLLLNKAPTAEELSALENNEIQWQTDTVEVVVKILECPSPHLFNAYLYLKVPYTPEDIHSVNISARYGKTLRDSVNISKPIPDYRLYDYLTRIVRERRSIEIKAKKVQVAKATALLKAKKLISEELGIDLDRLND
jgi:hypothetical protein